ncbi:MAG TPA: cytochrome c biogenesis protein ResB, partial [Dehalococcoidales bacterium]|nr:cytochrome c biogenesis protein ResB [Dehalococcoidales bacterium]
MSEIRQKHTKAWLKVKPAFRSVWKFLSSIKLAVILILVLVGLSLIGALVIQVPDELAADSQKYAAWLENTARLQTGVWYPILRLLGLFDVFHSVWFISTGLLLVANICVCSFNRWKPVRSLVGRRKPDTNPSHFLENPDRRLFAGMFSTERLISYLRKKGYRTETASEGRNSYLYAVKNRFSPLGTYLIHFSLIFFIVGYVTGQYWGFQNSSFALTEGETKAVGQDTRLALRLESFHIENYPDGSPRDYRSQVTLLEDEKEVTSALIRVNQPLKYRGVRFFQAYYGPTA